MPLAYSIRHKLMLKCAKKVLDLVEAFKRYKQQYALAQLFRPPGIELTSQKAVDTLSSFLTTFRLFMTLTFEILMPEYNHFMFAPNESKLSSPKQFMKYRADILWGDIKTQWLQI